ncbi:MAG: DUF1800 domain-containing protein [Acidobacteriaceae bacterium]
MRPIWMRLRVAIALATLLVTLSTTWLIAADKKSKDRLDERQRAIHALNRLTFGPRPGDVDRVMAMGVDKWIELQLNPRKIDDSALEARLAQFRTLKMDTREMLAEFPPPQVFKQVADGKMAMPHDPEKKAVYEAAIERYQNKQEKKQNKNGADNAQIQGQAQGQDEESMSDDMTPEERAQRRQARQQARADGERLMAMSPDERMDAILKMQPEERAALARALSPDEKLKLVDGMTPKQKETVLALANPFAVSSVELMQAKLDRAVYSERQLDEVMTDFWFNHFNVFIGKGPDRYLITAYERDVIRPHALGKFKDLLMATAQSPAMLFYLDNWESVGPNSQAALNRERMANGEMPQRLAHRGRFGGRKLTPEQQDKLKQLAQKAPKGLNENYAREVMELHTLGVNGGYTQKDVTELAKILTGWTIKQPRRGGGFEFNERVHEPGTKYFLGQKFKEDGEKEGERALEMLASSPATAKFISRKLAMRFVSDDPPEALVDRMAETFRKSDGDIREVLRTMFKSKEFWAPEAYRAKVKTPLEFVASALRATNADVKNGIPLIQQLNKMGMPLYGAQPPTGYSMKAETWVNSAALLARMNFAVALGVGRLPGVTVDLQNNPALLPGAVTGTQDAEKVLASLENSLLNGEISTQSHETIEKRLSDPVVSGRKLDDAPRPVVVGAVAGLILGSPEFQKR